MRYTTGIVTLLAIGLVACERTSLPAGAVELTPPDYFPTWWAMVEGCAGRTRPMAEVHWYSVPGDGFVDSRGNAVDGLYRNGPDALILPTERLSDGPTVRHEMLHAILDSRTGSDHPFDYFMRRCRGLVICSFDCRHSSDRPTALPPGILAADSSALEVAADFPATVSRSLHPWGAYVSVAVAVRNPKPTDIYVRLPKSGAFEYETSRASAAAPGCFCGSAFVATDADSLDGYFAANQTKRFILDVFVGPNDPLGEWAISASFAGRELTGRTFLRVNP